MDRADRARRLQAAAGRIRASAVLLPDEALTAPDPNSGERWDRGQVLAHVAEMLVYASEDAPVRRGDVLGSGTCGTGCILELSLVHGEDEYPWLQPGDVVTLEVDHLGRQESRVTEGRPVVPLRPE